MASNVFDINSKKPIEYSERNECVVQSRSIARDLSKGRSLDLSLYLDVLDPVKYLQKNLLTKYLNNLQLPIDMPNAMQRIEALEARVSQLEVYRRPLRSWEIDKLEDALDTSLLNNYISSGSEFDVYSKYLLLKVSDEKFDEFIDKFRQENLSIIVFHYKADGFVLQVERSELESVDLFDIKYQIYDKKSLDTLRSKYPLNREELDIALYNSMRIANGKDRV